MLKNQNIEKMINLKHSQLKMKVILSLLKEKDNLKKLYRMIEKVYLLMIIWEAITKIRILRTAHLL
jgi:hypothetical protein